MISTDQGIAIQPVSNPRLSSADLDNIVFGKLYSDHMFVMDYEDGKWQQAVIKEFGDLSMSPATLVLHYGQSIFEGLKAYRSAQGGVNIFRPKENIARMNRSAERLCMPQIPVDIFEEALEELIRLDQGWIPNADDASLYIRPFMYANDPYIGVKPSESYRFIIFTAPVNAYYKDPVRVKVEREFSRAFPGGTGATKCAGNYAASLYPAKLAQDQGYHQLVWTDGVEHKYIEESGTMNVFFLLGDTLVTPPTGGTILEGITRKSFIQLAKDKGHQVEERQITVDEILEAARSGLLKDAFGAGTAATIAHIESIAIDGEDFTLPPVAERTVSNSLAKLMDDIRRGRTEDKFGWNMVIKD